MMPPPHLTTHVYTPQTNSQRVVCKLHCGPTAVESWCQRRDIKVNEGKTQQYSSLVGIEYLMNGRRGGLTGMECLRTNINQTYGTSPLSRM